MLGFIGGGNMASAIGMAVIERGLRRPQDVWVSGPHIENLQRWEASGATVTTSNAEVCMKCDLIFLGVKPNMLDKVVAQCLESEEIQNIYGEPRCFVSMLAGVTLETLTQELQKITPALQVVRIMPNLPMKIGAGACLMTPGPTVEEKYIERVKQMIQSCGICEEVPEYLIDSVGAVSGCGPAFMYLIVEALADGAVKMGATRAMAIRLAAQTMMGSAKMVFKCGKHPAQLRDEVCSPGGSTICGVAALERGGVRNAIISAIEDAARRNKELGQ